MISNWGMQYTLEKIFLRAIRYYPCLFKKGFFEEDMSMKSFKTIIVSILGLPLSSLGKSAI
jgi:hypothetical protein